MQQKLLEDRLQVLDFIEALTIQAPDRSHYDFMLADFQLNSMTSSGVKNELDYLHRNGVVAFSLPADLILSTFWDAPIRVRNINVEKLHAVQHSTKEEIARIEGVKPRIRMGGDGDGRDVSGLSEVAKSAQERESPWSAANWMAALIGTIVSVLSAVFSWALLKTDAVRVLVLIDIGIFSIIFGRLYLRIRKKKLDWGQATDALMVAAVCIIAMVAYFTNSKPTVEDPKIAPSVPTNASAPSARPTNPSSSAPSANSTSPNAPASRYLINMEPVRGSSPNFAVGHQAVNGHDYQAVLYDATGNDSHCYTDSDYFNIDYNYHHFRATVGVADSTPSADAVTFAVLLDGKPQELYIDAHPHQPQGQGLKLSPGQTATIDISVSAAFRITLQGTCSSSNQSGSQVVAVWINPVVIK